MENIATNDEKSCVLLKQLVTVQFQLATIMSERFNRDTPKNKQSVIERKQNDINYQARRFSQKPELTNDALKSYSESLENVRNEYSLEKNMWLVQGNEFEQEEMNKTLETAKLKSKLSELKKEYRSREKNVALEKQIDEYRGRIESNRSDIRNSRYSSKESRNNVKESYVRYNNKLNEISNDNSIIRAEKGSEK